MIELSAQPMQLFRVIDPIKLRSVRCGKCNVLPERVRNDQDIGKQNCSIESESSNWLQCNFRRELRIKTKIEEITDLLPERTILRQISSGLPHQPDWRGRLSLTG
jgi:hypothetical protein